MILYGASGHAKVVISSLLSKKIPISAVYDDDKTKKKLLNYTITHDLDKLFELNDNFIISIGDNFIRKNVAEMLVCSFGKAVHSSSIIDDSAIIDEGTVIFHNSVIQSSVKIGKHVIVNTSASIDHDCVIEDYSHISPNATLSGNVKVGEGTHVGAGAVIIPNIEVGKWCKIGAGAVIIKDIPDYSVVVGNPGKVIKSYNPFIK